MKVLVVGGSGHIGSRIALALRETPEFQVSVGGRTPAQYCNGVLVRLDQPENFALADSFDAIINCTDTYRLSPVELFNYCMRSGKIFVETSADTDAYLALFDSYEKIPDEERRGIAVLGLGVFPGLSNILARKAVETTKERSGVEIHLSWSVLSGAGNGTCEVMLQGLARPIRHIRNGRIEAAAPIGKPRSVAYFDGLTNGLEIGLPEAILMHQSLGIQDCSTFVVPRPHIPRIVIWLVYLLARAGIFRPRIVQAILRCGFRVIRAGVLRNRVTRLGIVAVARGLDSGKTVVERTQCDDAFGCAADVVASCLASLTKQTRPNPGVYTADQLFSMDQMPTSVRE